MEVTLETHGADELDWAGSLLLVANHGSELDEALVRASLPKDRRRRLRVAVDDAVAQLEHGRTVLYFAEGAPSADGLVHDFDPRLGEIAERSGAAVVPVGIRGSYAARPPGRSWTAAGRPRVSVRFGASLRWHAPKKPEAGDEHGHLAFAVAVRRRVQALIEEDATSWWLTLRTDAVEAAPPAADWRRIWAQADEPTAGGGSRRAGIWSRNPRS